MIISIGFIFAQKTATKLTAQIITLMLLWCSPKSQKLLVFIIIKAATKISPAMTGFISASVVFTM